MLNIKCEKQTARGQETAIELKEYTLNQYGWRKVCGCFLFILFFMFIKGTVRFEPELLKNKQRNSF